ncbi:Serine acetyltransferase [Candidatus Ornithobacterium hominis]|uniref:Serine acetyltransferase n=1 Tax=Candidatus Ornithobacterium hominis TaxID=2497989 RepID=A0A383TWN1_9FLAO|nr:hypothetical protein [Candidatus Ornithobacterium hominis]MCT7904499.1 hypothetical protein [Candidatus Ornithobacterium hominis]SZD71396.1 Serine acetyltransferase [Candidatus Ornithobacterium hominis]
MEIIDFVSFLLKKVFKPIEIPNAFVEEALEITTKDVNYHFPLLEREFIIQNITCNNNELAIFLYRLGNICRKYERKDLLPQLHWLLKECCSCELYFNTEIDTGFYIVHGEGTVIGSRNTIGKGFKIYQGCTVGHRKSTPQEKGCTIGDNVTLFANSSIIGPIFIGAGGTIGAHCIITKDIPPNTIITFNRK